MRAPNQLVHSRARIRQRYAMFPLEGYPVSKVPNWGGCDVRILAAPAIGAQFSEYLIDLPAGNVQGYDHTFTQEFGFVLSGSLRISIEGEERELTAGGYFYVPEMGEYELNATRDSQLLLVRKRYEKSGLHKDELPESIVADSSAVPETPFMGNEHARLQILLPDAIAYDFAMNIFTFEPGHGLPYVETHVMEHGLFMLQGKGVYYLDDTWMEVEKNDFIWLGPYCPQSYYATGPEPTRYIYYKNVNREIPL